MAEKKASAEAKRKTFEKNKAALADLLFKLHSTGFTNVDIDILKEKVAEILNPAKKVAVTKVIPAMI